MLVYTREKCSVHLLSKTVKVDLILRDDAIDVQAGYRAEGSLAIFLRAHRQGTVDGTTRDRVF